MRSARDPHSAVPGARAAAGVGRLALAVVAVCAVAAALVLWGWAMMLVATHLGAGVGGLFGWLLLVAMGALAVAALAGSAWASLETDTVRRRRGLPPRGPEV